LARGALAVCACLLLVINTASADELQLRLRLAWGDGDAVRWRGEIALSEGTLSEPAPLGIEPDESGSMWFDDGVLKIAARSARRYEGVDLSIDAPRDAKLLVRLAPIEASATPEIEIPLAELIDGTKTVEVDDHQNRLVARRLPGDSLRVEFDRPHLVFDPEETFAFRLSPHELGIPAGTRVEITCELRPARTTESLWTAERTWSVPAEGERSETLDIDTPLPGEEGVYDLVVVARKRSLQRLGLKQTIAERRVQLVVVDPIAAPPTNSPLEPVLLEEIDPAGPKWWERLTTVPLIPGVRKGPLGSGDVRPLQLELGAFVELPPNASIEDVSWEAYPLPVKHPGQPHVLEIEFPSDAAQELGISVVEPNAAGAVAPVGVDSGIYIDEESQSGAPKVERFRLTFWPRTKTPLVLMTNRSGARRAVYGRIRLYEYPGSLPASPTVNTRPPSRRLAAYFDRPLWPENFGASEALDASSGRSLKDWKTFHDGGLRLIQYLQQSGRNAIVAPAWSDGCALYPSELIESTPRYDNGTFFSTGQDPERKDLLEMLFRLCDREGIAFTPMLDFSTPLTQLELLKRESAADGLEWVNGAGERWSEVEPSFRGQAPYYNALDERVQEAMTSVIEELVARYGDHPSFAGVAVQLSAHGYAQLPGIEWGYDPVTLSAFARDTGVAIAPTPTVARTLSVRDRAAWNDWRAARLAALHHRMQQAVTAKRADAKLFLTGAHLMERTGHNADLLPKLPRRGGMDQFWLLAGIAPEHYQSNDAPVLLRPSRLAPAGTLADQAIDLEINQAVDIDRRLERLPVTAAQFYHEPRTLRVHDFEKQSPFKSTYCWLVSQPTAVGEQNRRRFVHAVATLDAATMMDGGWMLPIGQDEAFRHIADAYRALPAKRFATFPGNLQPLVVRTLNTADETYLYLVNDTPWPTSATVAFHSQLPAVMENLSPSRKLPAAQAAGPRGTWAVDLEPYDLVAVRWNVPQVSITNIAVNVDPQVIADLEERVADIRARAAALPSAATIDALKNGDFETPAERGSAAPGWFLDGAADAFQVTAEGAHGGQRATKLATDTAPASLVGSPFPAPRLGRLQVDVWLKSEDGARELPMQVVVEGVIEGETFERRLPCGIVPETWTERNFQFDDLPWEGVEAIRLRFDMLGAGTVWIDDVTLTAPGFTQPEMVELGKLLQEARNRLVAGRLRDCQTMLDGYWPQFIERRAPAVNLERPAVEMANRPGNPQSTNATPPPKPGVLDRINQWMPRFVR
jgi:hypothetical protein